LDYFLNPIVHNLTFFLSLKIFYDLVRQINKKIPVKGNNTKPKSNSSGTNKKKSTCQLL